MGIFSYSDNLGEWEVVELPYFHQAGDYFVSVEETKGLKVTLGFFDSCRPKTFVVVEGDRGEEFIKVWVALTRMEKLQDAHGLSMVSFIFLASPASFSLHWLQTVKEVADSIKIVKDGRILRIE